MQTKFLKRLSLTIVIIIGIVLSMKSVREPDLWWQLRTGEWMLDNHEVTTSDIFSFTYEGVEWMNVKWGYEILQAIFVRIGGPSFLPVLQVIMTILILLILVRTSKILGQHLIHKDYKPTVGTYTVLIVVLILIEFRLTGRPESVSYLMTALYALLFIQHRIKPSKLIFLIIPLQILWSNLHESYGLGPILAIIFTSMAWFEYLFVSKHKWKKNSPVFSTVKTITVASVLCLLSVSLNPQGFRLLIHPIEIFSQLGRNKFTIELYSFTTKEYWNYHSFLTIVLFILSIRAISIKIFLQKKIKIKWWQHCINNIGLGYCTFMVATMYLALSANRNIPFVLIAITPLLAVAIDRWFLSRIKRGSQLKYYLLTVSVGVLIYLTIISGSFYRFVNSKDRFGLDVNVEKTPFGAACFLEDNKIKGKAFTDFLSSSYFLWHLQPDFKTYIDLRDLDIFPEMFFNNNFMLYEKPERIFPLADEDSKFDYIVLLNSPTFQQVNRYISGNSDFELVYGDILASVYLRKNEMNRPIIEKFGYNEGKRDVFHKFEPYKISAISKIFTSIFNPFYSYEDYSGLNYNRYRFLYYKYLGKELPKDGEMRGENRQS